MDASIEKPPDPEREPPLPAVKSQQRRRQEDNEPEDIIPHSAEKVKLKQGSP